MRRYAELKAAITLYTYVGCQTFAGGFDTGMVQAGFRLIHRAEMKGGFGLSSCLTNRHVLGKNWTYEAVPHEAWTPVRADVVVGNPPCSAWSVMSAKDFRGAESSILGCTWAFVDYAIKCDPYIIAFESVQQAFTKPDGLELMRRLRARVEERTGHRWDLHHVLHNAYSVGGAAQRRRYFWLISRVPFGIEPPEPRRLPALNDVISDLAPLGESWGAQSYRAPASRWAEPLRSPSGVVDGHVGLHTPLTRRVGDLLRGVEWRPGESISTVAHRFYDDNARLPDSFQATEEKIVKNEFRMGFTTPVRWDGECAARVITGGSLVTVVHPWLDRMITHREAARVLGFPDDWKIAPLRGVSGLSATWGKGISVQCGRWIGEWVYRALDGEPGAWRGDAIGEREWCVNVTNAWRKFMIQ